MLDMNTIIGGDTPKTETVVSTQDGQGMFAGLTNETVAKNTFTTLESNTYVVTPDSLVVKLSAKGNPWGTITYKVIDGEKTGRLAYAPVFFKKDENGNINIGGLDKFFADVYGKTVEEGKTIAVAFLKKFHENGQKDVKFDKTNGMPAINGVLEITENNYTNKQGVEVENQRFKFKKSV